MPVFFFFFFFFLGGGGGDVVLFFFFFLSLSLVLFLVFVLDSFRLRPRFLQPSRKKKREREREKKRLPTFGTFWGVSYHMVVLKKVIAEILLASLFTSSQNIRV